MARSCDAVYCKLCAEAILHRASMVRGQIAPVRNGRDIEAVHDMRVASRRLRAALTLFGPCLPAQADAWRKTIRKITRALGQARDLDVQIATIESQSRKRQNQAWRAGLKSLLADFRRRRRKAQGKVRRALTKMSSSGVLEEMQRTLEERAGAMPIVASNRAGAYRQAATAIRGLLGELESYDRDLARPDAVDRHHAMRIAAKHLRYSLEVFEPLYGSPLKPAIRAARNMQTMLGDLHDCDVWLEMLPQFVCKKLRGSTAKTLDKLIQAVEAFRQDRLGRRQGLYRQCVRYWGQCRKERIWPKLRQTLARAQGTKASRPPVRSNAARKAESVRRARSR